MATKEIIINQIALALRENREEAIPKLTIKVEEILTDLGMPNAKFQINLIQSETFLNTGKDIIELLFSANKGTNFGLIKKLFQVEKCLGLCWQ